jgi:carbon monoxide dehydrogenase subunit G
MPSAQRTIVIDRPPDEVFAFLADPANDQKWRPHVKEIAAEGQPRLGSKIHQVINGPGGRSITADIELTGYEPPTRYAFKVVTGPARAVGDFRLRSAGSGTELTFTLSAELGGLKKLLMSRPVQASMDGEMRSLDTAKRLIEAR